MGTGVGSGRGGSPPPYPERPPKPAAPPPIPPRPPHQPAQPARVRSGRAAAAAGLCLFLGLGLLTGAAIGHWLSGDPAAAQTAQDQAARGYAEDRQIWHSVPVDSLFPPTVTGAGLGPGGADRSWIRVGVVPDSDCAGAFDPALQRVLASAGCERLLRATYTDATSSSVITVGVLVAQADQKTMAALRARFGTAKYADRTDMMPRPVAFPGTDAAGFGPEQRASWAVDFPPLLPAVVYAVSGFADGRTVADPQPAAAAVEPGATSAPAQAGLGFDAQALAASVQSSLTAAARRLGHPATGAAQ